MLTASETIPRGDPRMKNPAYVITLAREDRYRRRIRCETDNGTVFLLDLPEATYLAPGDGLLLESGDIVEVHAAPEALLKITTDDPTALARVAWHIGNRHTPAEIATDAMFIQQDHVLADMLRGLGASVADVVRPFEPEGGAYGGHGSLHASHHGPAGTDHHSHDHVHDPAT
ncbi:MAG: urease accessory protein UreE [Pseudomonadota bacterium]